MERTNIAESILAGFRRLSTPNISDALDRLDISGGCLGIAPVLAGIKILGIAFTVRYIPAGIVKGTVGDYIDEVEPGTVVVLDNGGRMYCTVWGDLLTLAAARRGVAGTVIDGVCRDVPRIRELTYPVFARGCFMVTGKDRVQVDGINVPVTIGGVQVQPGDLIVGDDSGVVVIPKARAEQVLVAAQEIRAAETAIEQAIQRGEKLVDARKRYGYHQLQTKT